MVQILFRWVTQGSAEIEKEPPSIYLTKTTFKLHTYKTFFFTPNFTYPTSFFFERKHPLPRSSSNRAPSCMPFPHLELQVSLEVDQPRHGGHNQGVHSCGCRGRVHAVVAAKYLAIVPQISVVCCTAVLRGRVRRS